MCHGAIGHSVPVGNVDRRQRDWESSIEYAHRHPRLATMIVWSLVPLTLLIAGAALAHAVQGRWTLALYEGLVAGLVCWFRWRWVHLRRGSVRPPAIGRRA